ncbi:MAG: arsenate reductase ArsC [Thermoplasmatota archaeon]
MGDQPKTRVIFVCTGNTGRSQIAESLLRHHHGDRYEVFSAGTEPGVPDRLVLRALAELGIDVSGARSKGLDEFRDRTFDIAVTLCDQAHAVCPFVPGARTTIHQAFPDPADFGGSEEERMTRIRRLIEQIRAWLEETFEAGPPRSGPAGPGEYHFKLGET